MVQGAPGGVDCDVDPDQPITATATSGDVVVVPAETLGVALFPAIAPA